MGMETFIFIFKKDWRYSGNSSNSEFKNKDNSFYKKLIGSFMFLLVRKGIKLTFVVTFKIPENMFEFSQYLAFTFLNHLQLVLLMFF
jgi:hypothetical protein